MPGEKKEEEKKLKPCCACPETRKPRDQCIFERGETECKDLIEAHKECMRKLGFKVKVYEMCDEKINRYEAHSAMKTQRSQAQSEMTCPV